MIFHVIYIEDPFLNSCFYALKLIAQGRVSRRPHITIRGPFEKDSSNLEALNQQLAGNLATIHGLGEFRSGEKQVIYFKCSSANFSKVWSKPSFPVERYGINPHITIYDGPGNELSESILKAGASFSAFKFDIKASRLEKLVTGEQDSTAEAIKLISEVSQMPDFSIDHIRDLNFQERLHIASLLFNHLAKYVSK